MISKGCLALLLEQCLGLQSAEILIFQKSEELGPDLLGVPLSHST